RGPRAEGDGPPLSYVKVPSDVAGTYSGSAHQTVSGSYGVCDGLELSPAGEGSMSAWVYPTLPAGGRWQSVLTWLDHGGPAGLGVGHDRSGVVDTVQR